MKINDDCLYMVMRFGPDHRKDFAKVMEELRIKTYVDTFIKQMELSLMELYLELGDDAIDTLH
jgi:hypothetical protein